MDTPADIARAIHEKHSNGGEVPAYFEEFVSDVLSELQSTGRLVPADGMALTAEQWAHYQRMAADPRFIALSLDALGIVKWPENPLLPPTPLSEVESSEEPQELICPCRGRFGFHECNTVLAPAEPAEADYLGILTDMLKAADPYQRPLISWMTPAAVVVVPPLTEPSAIRAAADALSTALVILDPLETGHWEHAWRTLNDLDDCAKREKASATAEAGGWDTWDAVPENVTVVSSFLDHRYRKLDGEVFRVLEDGKRHKVADFTPTDMRSFAPFVAAEEG